MVTHAADKMHHLYRYKEVGDMAKKNHNIKVCEIHCNYSEQMDFVMCFAVFENKGGSLIERRGLNREKGA